MLRRQILKNREIIRVLWLNVDGSIKTYFYEILGKYLAACSSQLLSTIDNEEPFTIIRENSLAQRSIGHSVVNKSVTMMHLATNTLIRIVNRTTNIKSTQTVVNEKEKTPFESEISVYCIDEVCLTSLKKEINT